MHRTLSLALGLLFLAACGETPTEPRASVDVPAPSLAKAGAAGSGAFFVVGQGWNLNVADGFGNRCRATGAGDADDFIRTDKKGGDYVHFQDEDVTMTFTMADGSVHVMTGKVNANWYYESGYGNGLGTGVAQAMATGKDIAGPGTHKAFCSLRANKAGIIFPSVVIW